MKRPPRLRRERPALLRLLPLVILAVLAPRTSEAQRFSYGADRARTVQSLSLRYTQVHFEYAGDRDNPPILFGYGGPAYGAAFTRPNFIASVAIGTDQQVGVDGDARDRRLLDAALFTWGELYPLPELAGERYRLYVPVLLHSGFRRVRDRGPGEDTDAEFSVTALGLGTGVGLGGRLGEGVLFEARATPIFGLASPQFGGSIGTTRLFDADVLVHLGPLFGRFGLSFGYGFRAQAWNLRGSEFLDEIVADLYDYRGSQHAFRVGVNF